LWPNPDHPCHRCRPGSHAVKRTRQ
jgi:hypothetical protein